MKKVNESRIITKKDPVTGELYFPLDAFQDIIDTDKVAYYSYEETDNNSMTLKFYDENKQELPLKDEPETGDDNA
jgi:hypothetical protein